MAAATATGARAWPPFDVPQGFLAVPAAATSRPSSSSGHAGRRRPVEEKAATCGEAVFEELSKKMSRVRDQLGELERGRKEAAEAVGDLTRSQVTEIKNLARRPPEPIRRTLTAAWLLLNAKQFRKCTSVRFDEAKDWPRLQRMLGEEDFVKRVLNFDPACLAELPHITSHVAATYLGSQVGDRDGHSDSAHGQERQQHDHGEAAGVAPAPEEPSPRRHSLWSSPQKASPQKRLPRQLGRGLSRTSASLSGAGGLPKPPLDMASVARASEPCGRLLQWMLRLMVEDRERKRLLGELRHLEEQHRRAKEATRAEEPLSPRPPRPHSVVPPLRGMVISPVPDDALPARVAEPKLQASARRQGGLLPALSANPTPRTPEVQVTPLSEALVKPMLTPLKPMSPLSRAPPPPVKVELDVTGSLGCIRERLARLRATFVGHNGTAVANGDAQKVLAQIQQILREHRGRLKLKLVGHSVLGEREGVDLARAAAVADWLAEAAAGGRRQQLGGPPLISKGLFRLEGGGKSELGRCVVPVPIRELVPLYGPISREVASFSAPVGLYFEAKDAELSKESRTILGEMAIWLKDEAGGCMIEGHTDKSEPQDLALRRAHAVKAELVRLGAPARKLKLCPRDAMCPLSQHSAPNRRAELHLID